MNKDLDERLVPPGEYRDAMNIQVSTSEESNVGTIQNVLGNTPGCDWTNIPEYALGGSPIEAGSTTVGSVSDEKNDSLYWLVAGPSPDPSSLIPLPSGLTQVSFKDIILRKTATACESVFVDKYGFIVVNDDASGPSNSITLSDTSLYDSITTGMTVTGYDDVGGIVGAPTFVTSIGDLAQIDVDYFTGSITQPVAQDPVDLTFDFANQGGSCFGYGAGTAIGNYQLCSPIHIRTFDSSSFSCLGGPAVVPPSMGIFDDLVPCAGYFGPQLNIPPPGKSQLFIYVNDWDNDWGINVGSTILGEQTNPDSGVSGIAGLGFPSMVTRLASDAIVTDITLDFILSANGNAEQAYILTIDKQIASVPAGVYGEIDDTFSSEHSSNSLYAVIEPAAVNVTSPNNEINLNLNSQQWTNEIFDIIQAGGTIGIGGAGGSSGSGANWPADSCIDPTSVSNANDFVYSVVNCTELSSWLNNIGPFPSAQNALTYSGQKLSLFWVNTGPLESIYLNDATLDPSSTSFWYFESERVLNFDKDRLITGINIVDDMLFWTDNFSEPKKINIPRSIQGTDPSGNIHTSLINNSTGVVNEPIKEEHITVIRQAPKNALTMDLRSNRNPDLNYSGIVTISDSLNLAQSSIWNQVIDQVNNPGQFDPSIPYDFSFFNIGDVVKLTIPTDLDGNALFVLNDYEVGTKVVLKEFDADGIPPSVPFEEHTIKGEIVNWDWDPGTGIVQDANSFNSNNPPFGAKIAIKITSIVGEAPLADPATGVLDYVIDLFQETEKLFEFKFPRFSYRYKYEDGEYSTFAPFTNVAFIPGGFDYHPKKGYNLGMSNRLDHVLLRDFNTPITPKDVVEVDILYKEERSPNVYVVDTLSPTSEGTILDQATGTYVNNWQINEFKVDKDNIRAVLPANQMLRPFDNVPKKALGQEVTGNRIVYGNYEQNYDLTVGNNKYSPIFSKTISSRGDSKSIKSLREYQLGVVFTDKYGRETPVITSKSGTFKVEKESAINTSKLQLAIENTSVPLDMKYFRFYIKETSGEYYNMAMDRYWNADDGNIWISFPSSDRNKIDIDTFLILKKGLNDSDPVAEPARFKVIAIENEAPDFIKTTKNVLSDVAHKASTAVDNIFDQSFGIPTENSKTFSLNYDTVSAGQYLNRAVKNIHKPTTYDGELYFQLQNSSGAVTTEPIKIAKIDLVDDDERFEIILEKAFKSDVNKFTDDPDGINPTKIEDGNRAVIWNYKVENKPEFDGRFFVKIFNEATFTKYIIDNSTEETAAYVTFTSKKIYSLIDSHHSQVWKNPGAKGTFAFASSVGSTNPNDGWFHYKNWVDLWGQGNVGNASPNDSWTRYSAFFRGINVYRHRNDSNEDLGAHGIEARVDQLGQGLHNNTNNFDFEDVWFIDGSTSQGYFDVDAFNTHPNTSTISGAGVSNGIIDFGFGGVQPRDAAGAALDWHECSDQPGPDEGCKDDDIDFFEFEGNDRYQDANEISSNLVSGTIFKWKEDPTETLYEIKDVIRSRRVRYENINGSDEIGSLSAHWNFDGNASYFWLNDHIDFSGPASGNFQTTSYFRPENFTHNYKTEFVNLSNGSNTLTWNPYAYNAPIAAGITLVFEATADLVGGNEITLNALSVSDSSGNNYGPRTLEVGMVWSDAPSGNLAVVSRIDRNTNTVSFKNYDPINPDNTFGAVAAGTNLTFQQYGMNGISPNSAKNINFFNNGEGFGDSKIGVDAVGYTLEIVGPQTVEAEFPRFPAVWETEPKDTTDLDIYYEISNNNAIVLDTSTIESVLPVGSTLVILSDDTTGSGLPTGIFGDNSMLTIISNSDPNGNVIRVNRGLTTVLDGDKIEVTKPDGQIIEVQITSYANVPVPIAPGNHCDITIETNILNSVINSTWHNCYSFSNGVESNRVRDSFNQPFIGNGVKVSTTLSEQYKKEHRKYGLIYSGLYNSTSGVNNLNQFIQAEQITKDINPRYGSIQRLKAGWGQGGDLIALCEDRVLKILADKDALFNADGNTNVTATNRVLGTATPYSGEYGISTNPESFSSEAYRAYFTDKVRGTIMRLSRDGLTPISDAGMKDWFRDNLKLSNKLIGSYDDRKNEYNITVQDQNKTVTYREDVRGWVSFKSFIPENAISCANQYYSFKDGVLWRHHADQSISLANVPRNNFYNIQSFSSFDVLLNDAPGSIKTFHTLGYEGSQSKVDALASYDTWDVTSWDGTFDTSTGLPNYNNSTGIVSDVDYNNLASSSGWFAMDVRTDKEEGRVDRFIEKEGKWFNYIKGKKWQ